MNNTFLSNLSNEFNYTRTQNGALAHKSTMNAVLDLFALGGAYRQRSDEDAIFLFKKAFEEDEAYAMKCLFYLRDIREGQGERRFFRVCMRWLARNHEDAVRRNIKNFAEYGRWDDLYVLFGTPCEADALAFIKNQLILDVQSKTPSLLAKWLPSENTSSRKTVAQARIVRKYLGWTPKQYRKSLSKLRERINVLERLMSAGKWDEIEFDKIPSKAGLIYKNAFARHDVERMKMASKDNIVSYEDFAKDKTTKVNAKDLYPYEIVDKALHCANTATDRAMVEKFWDNQHDRLKGEPCKMLAVCDTSGSMTWGSGASTPINIAIGLSMYCAERIGGPFKNHYISFSSRPQLIKIEGIDFVDKVKRIYRANLCDNTNLTATFDMLLDIARRSDANDIPEVITVISDMQIDAGVCGMRYGDNANQKLLTEMETMREKWASYGLNMPRLVYWNVNASKDTILELGPNVQYCSGSSPALFEQILRSKSALQLMMDKLNGSRYEAVH